MGQLNELQNAYNDIVKARAFDEIAADPANTERNTEIIARTKARVYR